MAFRFGIVWLGTVFLPLIVFVGLAVYLYLWLREKRHRDELVESLLVEIQVQLDELHESLKAVGGDRRR